MTCLVGTHPLRLLLLLQRNHDDETSRKEARYSQEQTFASRTPLTPTSVQDTPSPKYWTPTLTPNDIMDPFIGRNSATLNGNLPDVLSNVSAQRPISPYLLTPTAIHVHPVQDRMRRHWQPNWIASNHGSISCTSNSVCVFIVFAIYPKLLKFFFTLLPLFHRNNTHPPLYFQPITPWPVPRPRLSSRLVRRVVLERLRPVRLLLLLSPSLLLQDVPPER